MIKGSVFESTTSLALEPKSPDFRLGMYRLSPFGFRPLRKSLETQPFVTLEICQVVKHKCQKPSISWLRVLFLLDTFPPSRCSWGRRSLLCRFGNLPGGPKLQWLQRSNVSIGRFPTKAPTLTKHSKSGKLTALSNCFPNTNAAAVPCTHIVSKTNQESKILAPKII